METNMPPRTCFRHARLLAVLAASALLGGCGLEAVHATPPGEMSPFRIDIEACELEGDVGEDASGARTKVAETLDAWAKEMPGGNGRPARFKVALKRDVTFYPWGLVPLVQMFTPMSRVTMRAEIRFQIAGDPREYTGSAEVADLCSLVTPCNPAEESAAATKKALAAATPTAVAAAPRSNRQL
jgi:hypothetical protein